MAKTPDPQATNKHGLKRSDFKIEGKRSVRQRCGFGCVICGSAIVQYHHFDPPFEEATEHRPEGITLLCGGCHDQVTRGLWSDDKVRWANANPRALKDRPHYAIDLRPPVNLILGSVLFRGGVGTLITVGSDRILDVGFDSEEGAALLNVKFFDDTGAPTVVVVDSELQFCADQWDVEVVGSLLKVRRGPGDIVFEAQLHPPHSIYVRRFGMTHRGWTIETNERGEVRIMSSRGTGIDFAKDGVSIFGGPLSLKEDGSYSQSGGLVAGSFSSKRFRRMALEGSVDRLLWEIALQPVIHVVPLVGEPSAWLINDPRGNEIERHATKAAAVEAAKALIAEDPTKRLVVHSQPGEDLEFFSADDA